MLLSISVTKKISRFVVDQPLDKIYSGSHWQTQYKTREFLTQKEAMQVWKKEFPYRKFPNNFKKSLLTKDEFLVLTHEVSTSKSDWWAALTVEQQTQYLKDHPRSKLEVTSKPKKGEKPTVATEKPKPKLGQKKEITGKVLNDFDPDEPLESLLATRKSVIKFKELGAKNHSLNKTFSKVFSANRFAKSIFNKYTQDDSTIINNKLRKPSSASKLSKKELDVIDGQIGIMEATFKTAPALEEDTTVYRGVHIGSKTNIFKQLKVGDSFKDPAFGSFSLDPSVAQNFADHAQPHYLKLVLPKGSKNAIYLDSISQYSLDNADEDEDEDADPEFEMLINKDTKFRVKSIKPITTDTRRKIGDRKVGSKIKHTIIEIEVID